MARGADLAAALFSASGAPPKLQVFPRRCHPASPLPSSSAPRALSADRCVPPDFRSSCPFLGGVLL